MSKKAKYTRPTVDLERVQYVQKLDAKKCK